MKVSKTKLRPVSLRGFSFELLVKTEYHLTKITERMSPGSSSYHRCLSDFQFWQPRLRLSVQFFAKTLTVPLGCLFFICSDLASIFSALAVEARLNDRLYK